MIQILEFYVIIALSCICWVALIIALKLKKKNEWFAWNNGSLRQDLERMNKVCDFLVRRIKK